MLLWLQAFWPTELDKVRMRERQHTMMTDHSASRNAIKYLSASIDRVEH